jgi:hypothetical protein
MQKASFPEKGEAYRLYWGLFLDAVSRLTRQGFVVQPADIDDLIHDFFAEAWDGLAGFGPSCSPMCLATVSRWMPSRRPISRWVTVGEGLEFWIEMSGTPAILDRNELVNVAARSALDL